MSTFNKQALSFRMNDNPVMSYWVRYLPEGASQTFVAHAPVVLASGLVVQAANPATAVLGFAVRAGQNTTAGLVNSEILPAVDGMSIFGNLLTTAAATRNFLAADVGTAFDLALSTTLLGASRPGWYFSAAGTTSVRVVSRHGDQFPPNVVNNTFVAVGDTDPRVEAVVLHAVRTWL